jgi:hypothetical protein
MAIQTRETLETRIKNWLIYLGIFVLVALTLVPLLGRFWSWLKDGLVPWDNAVQAASRVGFGIVAMGAVVACCILLLRLRWFPPDQERPAPSLVPAVVMIAIGATVVSTALFWQ